MRRINKCIKNLDWITVFFIEIFLVFFGIFIGSFFRKKNIKKLLFISMLSYLPIIGHTLTFCRKNKDYINKKINL